MWVWVTEFKREGGKKLHTHTVWSTSVTSDFVESKKMGQTSSKRRRRKRRRRRRKRRERDAPSGQWYRIYTLNPQFSLVQFVIQERPYITGTMMRMLIVSFYPHFAFSLSLSVSSGLFFPSLMSLLSLACSVSSRRVSLYSHNHLLVFSGDKWVATTWTCNNTHSLCYLCHFVLCCWCSLTGTCSLPCFASPLR